jgi:hypothetical protein
MSTDTATNQETPPVDPAVVAAADPAGDPPPAAAADPPADEPAPATDGEPQEGGHGNKGKPAWFMKELADLRHTKQLLNSEKEELAQRIAEQEEMLRRLQGGNDTNKTPSITPAQEEIDRRANEIVERRMASDRIASVVNAGRSSYTDWQDRAANLEAVGAASPELVLQVHSVDPANAHKIFHALSNDLEKAAQLARMDNNARTIELVRMSMALQPAATVTEPNPAAKPVPARTVSRAPAPPPPVDPAAVKVVDWRTDKDISDQEWSKRWDASARERAGLARR